MSWHALKVEEAVARANVAVEACLWLGTPYHHYGRLRGVGVDCAMLLAEVFEACGLVQHVDAGEYAFDWHLHHTEEQFLGWLARLGAREIDAAGVGDVAVYKFGRTYSHGAIVVSPQGDVVHAHQRMGAVVLGHLTEEPLAGRPARYFTLLGARAGDVAA